MFEDLSFYERCKPSMDPTPNHWGEECSGRCREGNSGGSWLGTIQNSLGDLQSLAVVSLRRRRARMHQGEARFWPKDERRISPHQPEGARNGEVHYEVFGWWHVLQEVEHATYPMEPTSCNEVRGLPEALCSGSDIGHFFTKIWSRWCLEICSSWS